MVDYLNRMDVRKMLNIPDKVGLYEGCSNDKDFSYNFQKEGSYFIYPLLIANGYKILKYSGDTDGVVATLGTHKWLDKMALKVKKEWRQWRNEEN